MLKLKIEAANGAEMREQLEALLGVYGGSKELNVEVAPKEYQPNQDVTITVVPPAKEEEAPEEVKEEKPKRRKTKKEEAVAEKAEEEVAEEEKTSAVTKEQLIQEVVNANRAGKRAEVIALLESFGVERTTALKEDQYSDFYNKIIKL